MLDTVLYKWLWPWSFSVQSLVFSESIPDIHLVQYVHFYSCNCENGCQGPEFIVSECNTEINIR